MANAKKIYQLKIALDYSKPPIWRRVLVDSSKSLADLHEIIQRAMGWYDCHLHHFMVGNRQTGMTFYGVNDPEFDMGFDDTEDEYKYRIDDLLHAEKDKISYEYDFGDGWLHTITLEKILDFDKSETLPKCVKAVRACPPEDIGGMGGYYHMLEMLADKNHPEREEFMEWLGMEEDEYFDEKYVNLKQINEYLTDL